jgi:ribokinase
MIESRQTRIVVIGSSNTDMIIKTDHIPRPGETVLGGEFFTAAGGKGANQAVAAARADRDVVFIGRVGDDVFGQRAIESFARDGIDTDYIIKDKEAPSGIALITVSADGENSIAVASGANARLSPADIENSADIIISASVLLMQLEIPIETVRRAAQIARDHDVRVILNPAPAQPLDDLLLSSVSVLTPNETETEMLTGIMPADPAALSRAAASLLSKGIAAVLITLGSRGVFVATPSLQELVPAFRVKAIDTTAAGDVFNGALAVALSENKSIVDAARFANAAAALSVTKLGAQPSAPYRAEIEYLLANLSY